MQPTESLPLDAIVAARSRLTDKILRTPLVPFNVADAPAPIYLKLENLQPIGSFKVRGAGNALACASAAQIAEGVFTASAGNMAQGVAWNARRLGVACSVIVPEHAPSNKLTAIARLGAKILRVPFDEWWRIIEEHHHPDVRGLFVHPVSDPAVMAGNGTIGLEILEDLPDVATVIVPFGGGGLACGIAAAVKARKPGVRVWAAEVETAAPLAAAFAAGGPVEVPYRPSFVDGIGGKRVLAEMWPLIRALVDDAIVSPLSAVAEAVRLLVERNRIVAEGAGAAALAAALATEPDAGKVVCIISGGNIDSHKLAAILAGDVP